MVKIPYVDNVSFILNFSDAVQLRPLEPHILHKDIFRDGRVFGLIAEYLLEAIFKNLTRVSDEASDHDIYDSQTKGSYEARVVTRGGVNLIPSGQIGSGRAYDEQKYRDKRDKIDGYIFIDIREFPIVIVIGIPEENVPFKKKVTSQGFNSLRQEVSERDANKKI